MNIIYLEKKIRNIYADRVCTPFNKLLFKFK